MTEARIVCDPNILAGKPTIAGTRISVELILDKLGAGESIEDILADYTHLTRAHILAALQFAAQSVRNDVFYPFEAKSA